MGTWLGLGDSEGLSTLPPLCQVPLVVTAPSAVQKSPGSPFLQSPPLPCISLFPGPGGATIRNHQARRMAIRNLTCFYS